MVPRPREWSRLHGETDAGYAAFQEWLHSQDGNGFRQDVYEWAGRWEDDGRRSEVLQWAASDFWLIRAKAYDEWVGKRQVIKNFPLCAPAGVLMVKIATTELEKISAMQDRAGEVPGALDARLIDRWFARVLKMEEAAKKWDTIQAASLTPGQALYDFTKLEIDEIRALEALHEKAKL
jgi:hypothetical protein